MSNPQRIIDLTINLSDDLNGVEISSVKTIEKDGWNTSYYKIYSHVGTHMDAPRHFGNADQAIDEIAVGRFITPAWIIDATDVGPKGFITLRHLGVLLSEFSPGESLIIKTGWSSRLGTPEYLDDLPRISKELAEWCVENRVNILAVEQPSVADVHNLEEVTEIHKILMDGDVIIVESLINVEQITAAKVTMIAMPLKVKDGDGAPARVVAIL
ncbi:cyclase family protein [Portibacter lacus]|uniref:Cyclase n=1 Tax=Portibacter lacus TaxID=1099794 RepID=A0AA37SSC4_9BACT|nr:cyclase family protein [Portibacter lacus]GLR18789.1 cyclase [Portibacter lacus]